VTLWAWAPLPEFSLTQTMGSGCQTPRTRPCPGWAQSPSVLWSWKSSSNQLVALSLPWPPVFRQPSAYLQGSGPAANLPPLLMQAAVLSATITVGPPQLNPSGKPDCEAAALALASSLSHGLPYCWVFCTHMAPTHTHTHTHTHRSLDP
jgi:hypothetical protein